METKGTQGTASLGYEPEGRGFESLRARQSASPGRNKCLWQVAAPVVGLNSSSVAVVAEGDLPRTASIERNEVPAVQISICAGPNLKSEAIDPKRLLETVASILSV